MFAWISILSITSSVFRWGSTNRWWCRKKDCCICHSVKSRHCQSGNHFRSRRRGSEVALLQTSHRGCFLGEGPSQHAWDDLDRRVVCNIFLSCEIFIVWNFAFVVANSEPRAQKIRKIRNLYKRQNTSRDMRIQRRYLFWNGKHENEYLAEGYIWAYTTQNSHILQHAPPV